MYIAALMSIDQEQYEAARVDGAGRFACMWYITLPGLLPTFFVLLILQIANFINNGMEQYFVFQHAMNREHIEVLDLYVYNQGITGINYSYSIAIGMLKSIVSLVLLFAANKGSKLFRKESIF
jgi:putative aldouronate transport system permease protein